METGTLKEETTPVKNEFDTNLEGWIEREKAALRLISKVGQLWLDRSVELIIFRNQLIDRSVSEILNLHEYAREVVKKPVTVFETSEMADEMLKLDLAPSRIDVGKLAAEWLAEKENFSSVADFLNNRLSTFIGKDKRHITPKDVVLYGFGRIGRLAARELISQAGKGEQLRLKAIVTRGNSDEEISKRAALLRVDSVHGPFPGTIAEDFKNKALIINGHMVKIIAASNPAEIDYESYGIKNALIIDNTGVARDRDGLGLHLKAKGVDKVLLTAPGKGDIPNTVYGVNQENLDLENEKIFSAASCTTNAIVPVLKVIDENLQIISGHIETIHAYTNDQNLLDNYHKKYRRGRSAALNMVITETGAASAITKVLPSMSGKFTANAVRVPVPDASLAILSLTVGKEVTKEDVNEVMKNAALNGNLVEQIQYSFNNELVSSDIIGNSCASVFDSPATLVSGDKKSIVLYVWYDNEYGYTRQVLRLGKYLADVRRLRYY